MKQPIVLTAHDTLLKLLGDRSHYLNKWLTHIKADPDKHTILQFPVPLSPLSSHYFLVEKVKVPMLVKAFGNGAIEAADYLTRCPNIVIKQGVKQKSGDDAPSHRVQSGDDAPSHRVQKVTVN